MFIVLVSINKKRTVLCALSPNWLC